MPTLAETTGNVRVVIRHVGPRGPIGISIPAGGSSNQILAKASGDDYDFRWINPPDALLANIVIGPAVTVVGNIAVFAGTDGSEIDDSGMALTDLATTAYADAVSANDFDDTYKGHLDGFVAAFPSHYNQFRGDYASEALLIAGAPPADGVWGDYAFATVSGDKRLFFLNATTDTWVDVGSFTVAMTADEIAALIFDFTGTFDKNDSNIFTDNYKALVDSHESTISTLVGAAGATSTAITTVAIDYTLLATDRTVVFAPGAGITAVCQLPASAALRGKVYAIKCLGDATADVDITPFGSETIDGTAGVLTITDKQYKTIQSTGAGWIVLG
jgi:hypothetical protein